MTTLAEYRQFVTECVNNAARATKSKDQTTWLEMAQHWERLASEAERSQGVSTGEGPKLDRLSWRASSFGQWSERASLLAIWLHGPLPFPPPMPKKLTTTRRRALQLLADSPGGCTESIALAYGIPAQLIEELVDAGLATATTERAKAGGRTIEVIRIRITEAGRRALA